MATVDRERIGRALMAHRAAVTRWLRLLGVHEHDAEDAAQAVFLSAFLRWGDYRPDMPLARWLYGFARGVAANWRRGRRREPETVPLLEHAGAVCPQGWLEARSELRALPGCMRTMLSAMAEDNFTIAAGARALSIDPSTAGVRIAALRRGKAG